MTAQVLVLESPRGRELRAMRAHKRSYSAYCDGDYVKAIEQALDCLDITPDFRDAWDLIVLALVALAERPVGGRT
jgi:hypothetical protein